MSCPQQAASVKPSAYCVQMCSSSTLQCSLVMETATLSDWSDAVRREKLQKYNVWVFQITRAVRRFSMTYHVPFHSRSVLRALAVMGVSQDSIWSTGGWTILPSQPMFPGPVVSCRGQWSPHLWRSGCLAAMRLQVTRYGHVRVYTYVPAGEERVVGPRRARSKGACAVPAPGKALVPT